MRPRTELALAVGIGARSMQECLLLQIDRMEPRDPAHTLLRRVVAEHGIGKMKVGRVASERYRNPVGRHTLIMKNVAGLHNLMYA